MNMRIVLAVWCIIVGGLLFIIEDGKIIKICIACNSSLFLALGVISIVLGAIGIVVGLKGQAVIRKSDLQRPANSFAGLIKYTFGCARPLALAPEVRA